MASEGMIQNVEGEVTMKQKPVFKSECGKNAIFAVYDSVLEKWPVPYEDLNLKTRYGNTYVVACGEATKPPLILLHRSTSNSSMWIGDVATYSKHFRVYAIDIPGEAGKSQDTRYELSSPSYAEWLDDVLMSLNITKALFVGISLGGWVLLKFATIYPQKVEKLVLMCPLGIAPQKISFLLYMIPMMMLGKWGRKKVAKKIFGNYDIPKEALEYSKLIGDNFNPYVGVAPIFSDEELKRLTMPFLLIAGDKDVFFDSKKTAARLSVVLPGTDVRILPGVGHVLIRQEEKICTFLQK